MRTPPQSVFNRTEKCAYSFNHSLQPRRTDLEAAATAQCGHVTHTVHALWTLSFKNLAKICQNCFKSPKVQKSTICQLRSQFRRTDLEAAAAMLRTLCMHCGLFLFKIWLKFVQIVLKVQRSKKSKIYQFGFQPRR